MCNVACRQRASLLTLIGMLGELTAQQPAAIFEPARPGDVTGSLADLTNAQVRSGYAAKVSLRYRLRETAGWMRRTVGVG